jgi:hypothetical protein
VPNGSSRFGNATEANLLAALHLECGGQGVDCVCARPGVQYYGAAGQAQLLLAPKPVAAVGVLPHSNLVGLSFQNPGNQPAVEHLSPMWCSDVWDATDWTSLLTSSATTLLVQRMQWQLGWMAGVHDIHQLHGQEPDLQRAP